MRPESDESCCSLVSDAEPPPFGSTADLAQLYEFVGCYETGNASDLCALSKEANGGRNTPSGLARLRRSRLGPAVPRSLLQRPPCGTALAAAEGTRTRSYDRPTYNKPVHAEDQHALCLASALHFSIRAMFSQLSV